MKANIQNTKSAIWMMELGVEFEYIATSPLKAKFKIMLLMVYVDIFSQIWWEFINESPVRGTQKQRFSSWSDSFVFCKSNSHFEKHKEEFHLLDGNVFYKIRNSLLHFGGLPDLEGIPVFIYPYTRGEFLGRFSHKLGNSEVLVLCPKVLFVAVAIAIANTIEKMIGGATDDEGKDKIMKKIYERIQNESALPINIKID